MGIVITHPEMGIYLGNCLGLGFWTLLDTAGQSRAVIFESGHQAREHVVSWVSHNDPEQYGFHEVKCANEFFATVEELKLAGLAGLLGGMELEYLHNAPAMGLC